MFLPAHQVILPLSAHNVLGWMRCLVHNGCPQFSLCLAEQGSILVLYCVFLTMALLH